MGWKETKEMDASGAWWLIAITLVSVGAGLISWKRRRGTPATPTPARLVYTAHVKQRMSERGVLPQQIESVLAAPTRQLRDPSNCSVRLEREIEGRTLKVWVAQPWPTSDDVVIKSTAWTDCCLTFQIAPALTGLVIGRGGTTVRQIESANDVRISVSRSGEVRISASLPRSAESAKRQILSLVAHGGNGHSLPRVA